MCREGGIIEITISLDFTNACLLGVSLMSNATAFEFNLRCVFNSINSRLASATVIYQLLYTDSLIKYSINTVADLPAPNNNIFFALIKAV